MEKLDYYLLAKAESELKCKAEREKVIESLKQLAHLAEKHNEYYSAAIARYMLRYLGAEHV